MLQKFTNWLRSIFTPSNTVEIVKESECTCDKCNCDDSVEITKPAASIENNELPNDSNKKEACKVNNTEKKLNGTKKVITDKKPKANKSSDKKLEKNESSKQEVNKSTKKRVTKKVDKNSAESQQQENVEKTKKKSVKKTAKKTEKKD